MAAAASSTSPALQALCRELRSSPNGLDSREAARRLTAWGPNEITRRAGARWRREFAAQILHPLALLLAAAAALAWATGSAGLAIAVLAVVGINAMFAFAQERHAEHAVEALAAYVPDRALVVRDGHTVDVEARTLVAGDLMWVAEGDRVCADGRIIDGAVDIDLSTLTGESAPVRRAAGDDGAVPPLQARDRVFSGTACTAGWARVLVTATGMRTELGRISALSERTEQAESPLERQVRRVAWVIAAVAVAIGAAFLPVGVAAGMGWAAAATFAIGMIVANVPEGLLPTITLALALGVRNLARHHAVVKRLSAVETLGSATVICTDKTGTLTLNRMQVSEIWTPEGRQRLDRGRDATPALHHLVRTAASCTTAELAAESAPPVPASPAPAAAGQAPAARAGGAPADGAPADGAPADGAPAGGVGDPTELALLDLARDLGDAVDAGSRDAARSAVFAFDPELQRMSTVDTAAGTTPVLHSKGAPEQLLPLCTRLARDGTTAPMTAPDLVRARHLIDGAAARGLRVLAVAERDLGSGPTPADRNAAERDLTFLGLVALLDPPRPGVAAAIAQAHTAGIRIHVVTGDNGLTAAEIARRVGIGDAHSPIVTGAELDALSEDELDDLLGSGPEIIFARSSPEAKLRISDALQARGAVVAMTGDGVNDAPALRRNDIGIAMGRSGTDVAREAATMVLTDDDFATIVVAIKLGRQVYDNVRKFIVYIFAHAVPEILPFLVFALAGGRIPLPLTVMQILAIDLGTEIIPSLALSREPAEPGIMHRPPRPRDEGVITPAMFLRAWGVLGLTSAMLGMAAYLFVLDRAGWHPGDPVGPGTPLHQAYLQATTVTWLGIVAGQLGAGFACRAQRVSVVSVGLLSNPWLLLGFASSLVFAAVLIYVPALHPVFGTADLSAGQLLLVAPFPVLVWAADELYRWGLRHRAVRIRPGLFGTEVPRTSARNSDAG